MKLPLEDRSLTLYPRSYRWIGGDYDINTGERLEKREVRLYLSPMENGVRDNKINVINDHKSTFVKGLR